MVFEGLDHLFGCIAAMSVGVDEFEGCLPFFLNLEFLCGDSFVV